MATLKYDYLAAKKAGLTDTDIANYLASQSGYDIEGAREAGLKDNEIISYLNRTEAGALETFMTAARQAVGSEITGAAQLLGQEPSAEQVAQESLVRQMTSENPVSGIAGTIVGSLVNPSTLIPGSLIFKGGKGLIAGGAAAGGVGGFLNPIYDPESELSRGATTAVGAVAGTVLGGAAALLSRKYGAQAAQQIVQAAEQKLATGAAKSADEAVAVAERELQEAIPPQVLGGEQAAPVTQDSISPLISRIEDLETRARVEQDVAQGDYRSFFTEAPFRASETPDFRVTTAFSADNPFRTQNLESYLQSGYKAADPEELLTRIVQANKAAVKSELDTTPIDIPADSAVNFLLNRKVQEIGGRDVINAYLPELQRGVDMIRNIDELFLNGRAAGMTDAEIAAVFKKDFDEVKPILFSAIGNVSNVGRALQAAKAQKAIIGSTEQILKGLAKNGGQELQDILALKDAVALVKSTGGTSFDKNKAIAELTKAAVKEPNWRDKFGEYVVNSYISGLATPAVNAISGVAKLGLLSVERVLQGLNPASKVKLGEVLPAFRGMMDGLLEGAYFAKEGFLRGNPLDNVQPEIKGAIGMQTGASKAEKVLGNIVRTPGRVSVGIDEFFKSIFRRMEYNAQAYRIASTGKYGNPDDVYNALRNVNTKSVDWKDQILSAKNLPQLTDVQRTQLISDVTEFAKSATFQSDLGKFGNNILRFRAQHPELAWVIPFVKTPINIMKDALSYTPLGVFSKNTPTDVKIARTAIGLGVTAGLAQLVGENKITGSYPRDADKRNAMIAAGLPEYSIKIGDTWFSYARVEPLATIMGSAVDGINAVVTYRNRPAYDTKKEKELAIDVVAGVTKNIASKTFLEGISGVLQAIHDPERYGGSFINSFAGLIVPSFVAAPARAQDPSMRVVSSFGEAVQNRIPDFGLGTPIPSRQELPAQSMLYGGERPNPAAGFAAFTGIQTAPAEQSLLQQEAARVKFDYDLPSKKLRGVELSGAEQAEYQALSSRYADQILGNLIQSSAYQNAPDSLKRVFLERGMRNARKVATNLMFAQKMQDPEYRTQYIRERLRKKGIEEE